MNMLGNSISVKCNNGASKGNNFHTNSCNLFAKTIPFYWIWIQMEPFEYSSLKIWEHIFYCHYVLRMLFRDSD